MYVSVYVCVCDHTHRVSWRIVFHRVCPDEHDVALVLGARFIVSFAKLFFFLGARDKKKQTRHRDADVKKKEQTRGERVSEVIKFFFFVLFFCFVLFTRCFIVPRSIFKSKHAIQ